MGELHLDVLVDRMVARVLGGRERRQAAGGVPRDDHQSRSRRSRSANVRQTGGKGQYGHVVISLEPTGPGGGYEFVDRSPVA